MRKALQIAKAAGHVAYDLARCGVGVGDVVLGATATLVLSVLRLKPDAAPVRAALASFVGDVRDLNDSARRLSDAVRGRDRPASVPTQVPAAPPVPLDGTLWNNALGLARENLDTKKAEVTLARVRKGYLIKSLTLGVSLAGTVLAAVATGLTGGAAAPALVVSVLALRFAMANWKCARRNLELAKAGKPTLPMGNSAFGNALYEQYTLAGLPDRQARDEANRNAVLTGLLVTAMGVGLGFGMHVSLPDSAAVPVGSLRMAASLLKNCVLPGADFARNQAHAHESAMWDASKGVESAARTDWLKILGDNPERAAQYRHWLDGRPSGTAALLAPLAIETRPEHQRGPAPGAAAVDVATLDLQPLVDWTVASSTGRLNELPTWLQDGSNKWLQEITQDLESSRRRANESLASDVIDASVSMWGTVNGIMGLA